MNKQNTGQMDKEEIKRQKEKKLKKLKDKEKIDK